MCLRTIRGEIYETDIDTKYYIFYILNVHVDNSFSQS
jgi:hypothetical protein